MRRLVWISIDHSEKPAVIRCGRCRGKVDLPLDTPLGQPSSIMCAFLGAHRGCEAAIVPPAPRPRGAPIPIQKPQH